MKFTYALALAHIATAIEISVQDEHETGLCACLTSHGPNVTVHNPPDEDAHIEVVYDGQVFDYPADYGLNTCAAWDAGEAPFCADNLFGFCTANWCYVSNDCAASDTQPSNVIEGLSYSYATCGDVGDFPDIGEFPEGTTLQDIIDMATGEDGSSEDGAGEDGAGEDGAGEDSAGEDGADEDGAGEDAADDNDQGSNNVTIKIDFDLDVVHE